MEARQRDGDATAGEPHPFRDFSNDPDLRICVVPPGHQQDAVVAADVDWQRHRHARKHYGIVQWNELESRHAIDVMPNS